MTTIAAAHPGAFHALQQRPVQGPRASASFEVALAAFTKAGFSPADAYAAVKTVSLQALMVGVERSMVARGDMPQTEIEELPSEAFPLVRAVAAEHDYEDTWAFACETLVAGLRSQLRRRKGDVTSV
jgi:hypothetical protein